MRPCWAYCASKKFTKIKPGLRCPADIQTKLISNDLDLGLCSRFILTVCLPCESTFWTSVFGRLLPPGKLGREQFTNNGKVSLFT